ncbi:MAG: elongation factor P [Nitrospiria bacterium]
MIFTTDFRSGLRIQVEGDPYEIIEFQHVKPGKGGAFVRTRLRNLKTGNVNEKTFRAGERFEEPPIEDREMQFLYAQGRDCYFMDTSSYEQVSVTDEQLGGAKDFIKENMVVKIMFYQGKPLGVQLPVFVELKVVETAPGVRGDTATGGTKPATLETGTVIKVPFHIGQGDIIKIDTRTRAYVERAK